MTNLTRIVAVVVDVKKATFYKEDGETVVLFQGDPRLRPILEQITPQLEEQKYADVDFTSENAWKEFEEKANGAVRLFRIAKSKLANWFGTKKETSPPIELGAVPKEQLNQERAKSAVDEILKHATPVKDPNFTEDTVACQRPVAEMNNQTPNDRTNEGKDAHFDKHRDTIIAVTESGKVVPGVERIKSQFVAAGKGDNIKGMALFLERIGAVTEKRSHTTADLLRFMERGDLPIADDGCIIIYKKLERTNQPGIYVDVHSKRVLQKVGSYVHMDSKMVDHNRRNECSNGLHVARRGYIGSFGGNVIVLAKVRPEDVIAVPDYDANKMRVCGYHIIAELTPMQFQAINTNRPISQAEGGEELLGRAISGDHIAVIQRVHIGGDKGTNLTITDLVDAPVTTEASTTTQEETRVQESSEVVVAAKVKKAVSKKTKKANRKVAVKKAVATAAAKKVKPIDAAGKTYGDKPVDVKAVVKLKAGQTDSLAVEKKGPVTQTEIATAMWDAALGGNAAKARELLAFKKAAKKGWHTWGLPDTAGETLKALLQ